MSRSYRGVMGCLAMVGLVTALAGSGAAQAVEFQITIENLSPNVLTPAPFISHDGGFDLFDEGAFASPEIELLAEDGMPTGVVDLATAALGTTVADFEVAFGAGGPIVPGESVTVTVDADMAHPWLSYASMFAFSNDAFIGGAAGDGAIDLFPGGVPFAGVIMLAPGVVWDAGTEVNDELAAHVPALGAPVGAGVPEGVGIFRPHAGVLGIGDIPLSRNWTGGNVARITIVPEPGTLALLGVAGAWLVSRRRPRSIA